ncbi:iron-containing redox enzyme family protein [Leptolyngbya sp. AN03gr2]|uniref:iron-containing redox enzyme family protein n=1 Tax=unclassified Leptolyngbya TaxID=2650499 RepID=UPI003D31C813
MTVIHEQSEIRQRDLQLSRKATVDYLDSLEAQILRHKGVEHPFLNRYRTTKLDLKNTHSLFLEFYYFIYHLPFYIAGMAMSTRDERILRELAINLVEETGGRQNINAKSSRREEMPHLDIYRNFLMKLGLREESIVSYGCLQSTVAVDAGICKLYTQQPIEKSLGAMYALETMSGSMCSKLNDGLQHSGYDRAERFFFELHSIREEGHANGVFNAVQPYLDTSAAKQLFESGIQEFMLLMENFWDGVESICGFSS